MYSDTDGNSSLGRDNLLEAEVITDMDDFLFEFPGLVCEWMLATR